VHDVVCTYRDGGKKTIREDEQETPRLALHIGKYPVVLVAPNDIELIWDGSEMRRKFFDSLLSQLDSQYLENLIVYTNYLRQRNGLLRVFAERGVDRTVLEAYDQKLIPAGEAIFRARKEFINRFMPSFESHYRFMAGDANEKVGIRYQSQLEEMNFKSALESQLEKDIRLQRTTVGIHRDDFVFTFMNGDLKRIGSQGQQKSFLISLKLTEFEVLTEAKKFKPLLLLDDIFDKLDEERIQKLMELVTNDTFGQLFITDARSQRSQQLFRDTGIRADVLEVNNGLVRPLV
jgi:DNA replication and repair protein RecF